MKFKIKISGVLLAVLFTIVINIYAVGDGNCPNIYDLYHADLQDVGCLDSEGNPTGQEKKDCVEVAFKCCRTTMQTPCILPN